MFSINANVRKEQGKGASRRLRQAGKFPAIIYGGNKEALVIELDHDKVMNLSHKEGFYTEILTLMVDDEAIKVTIQAVQRHVYKPKFTHIDFMRA